MYKKRVTEWMSWTKVKDEGMALVLQRHSELQMRASITSLVDGQARWWIGANSRFLWHLAWPVVWIEVSSGFL